MSNELDNNVNVKEEIKTITKNLVESLSQISAGINEVAIGVQQLAERNTQLLKETNEANEKAKNSDEIVGIIQDISKQTTLLGLNASIEAARAGESGKGFKIVANEMGKLSQMSAESVVSINETLGDMKKSIDDVVKTINEIYDSSFKNSDEAENIIVKLENALK